MIRGLLAAVLAVALILASAAPASAEPLLSPDDAADLAQTLAEAQAEQGICYGWSVLVDSIGEETGSSIAGPGQPLFDPDKCQKGSVVLSGGIDYTGQYDDAEDSAEIQILSTGIDGPSVRDLERLGLKASDLVGEQDDQALFDMVGALPLLVAESGAAPYVEYEPAGLDVPATDRPTNKPTSDFVRTALPILGLGVALILAGLFWLLYKSGQVRGRRTST